MTNAEILQEAFSPCGRMGLKLRNGFIRSATLEMMAASDGAPTPELKALYAGLASGGGGSPLYERVSCGPRLASPAGPIPDPRQR